MNSGLNSGGGARPGLWVVATPIGNLGDLPPRARDALARADLLLCEDTRRTANLLSALGLSKTLLRLDAHASHREIADWVGRMRGGECFAYVTDAGTPAISDPGARLVRAAQEAGVTVSPVPGASAVATLLSVAGFEGTAFAFRGFFPRKDGERAQEIALCRANPAFRAAVWFESPERIGAALAALSEAAPEARAVAGKELTKAFEKLFSGDLKTVSAAVADELAREGARGEWVFAVEFAAVDAVDAAEKSSDWVKALECLLFARVSASRAARQVSQYFGVSRNAAYARALELAPRIAADDSPSQD